MIWSPDQLALIDPATELEIAVRQADGGLHRWTPIWVVSVEGQVYVRTWYRRDSGWYGRARRSRQARVRVPGLKADVSIEDVGTKAPDSLRSGIDDAYRVKYGSRGAESMITPAAQATSLRLAPDR